MLLRRYKTYLKICFASLCMIAALMMISSYYIDSGDSGKRLQSDQMTIDKLINSNTTMMDDPELVKIVRENWLYPPSQVSYNLTNPKKVDYSQISESSFLNTLMNKKKGGFFVECGAFDGERFSVSLMFEKYQDWTGLLIEANPILFEMLQTKHRKSYITAACASASQHPEKVRFQNAHGLGGIESEISADHQSRIDRKDWRGEVVTVQCFPIYTMLLAIGLPTVDLFVLDVEGAEVNILKTIPFDKVKINLFYIEHNLSKERKEEIKAIMENNGYEFVRNLSFNCIYQLKSSKY